MIIYALIQEEQSISPTARIILLLAFFLGIGFIIISRFYTFFEQLHAKKHRKPFFRAFPFFRRKLDASQKRVLDREFTFYQKLNDKQKLLFEHRVASFINDKTFVGRDNLTVDGKMKVLIASTAVMLTFGYRDYIIKIISTIIIYPEAFYSNTNRELHKGEFNPHLGVLALSWKDFVEGYDISNDNLNLGVHEFAHAIHLESIHRPGINAIIFSESFIELTEYLDRHEGVKDKLIASRYFREYAYTNQYEFVAVVIENFIETPLEFRQQFPVVFKSVKQMLNFQL
ncbi:zinc-dependent peptidase [Winogradskyella sp. 3972H.M.0a.05]|uniref:zinc-dependent peptidase n=1 Tax=Winogradskyella sp. 3972H.M.0a.05 TaxID=2950277 RepID=UPI0033994373